MPGHNVIMIQSFLHITNLPSPLSSWQPESSGFIDPCPFESIDQNLGKEEKENILEFHSRGLQQGVDIIPWVLWNLCDRWKKLQQQPYIKLAALKWSSALQHAVSLGIELWTVMEGSFATMGFLSMTSGMFLPIVLIRVCFQRVNMTNLVHRNENNGDTQHKIDGESMAKQCCRCQTRKYCSHCWWVLLQYCICTAGTSTDQVTGWHSAYNKETAAHSPRSWEV